MAGIYRNSTETYRNLYLAKIIPTGSGDARSGAKHHTAAGTILAVGKALFVVLVLVWKRL